MTSVNLYKNVGEVEREEEETSFLDEFSECVWDALESTTVKVLFGLQFVLLIAIVLVASSITHHRLIQQLTTAYNDIKNNSHHNHQNNSTVRNADPTSQLAQSLGKQLGQKLYLAVET